jgi:hypothetical protein
MFVSSERRDAAQEPCRYETPGSPADFQITTDVTMPGATICVSRRGIPQSRHVPRPVPGRLTRRAVGSFALQPPPRNRIRGGKCRSWRVHRLPAFAEGAFLVSQGATSAPLSYAYPQTLRLIGFGDPRESIPDPTPSARRGCVEDSEILEHKHSPRVRNAMMGPSRDWTKSQRPGTCRHREAPSAGTPVAWRWKFPRAAGNSRSRPRGWMRSRADRARVEAYRLLVRIRTNSPWHTQASGSGTRFG